MANRQVIMAGCVNEHTTPDFTVHPDFEAVLVLGLGEGDEVWLESQGLPPSRLSAGLSPFPKAARKARLRKQPGTSPLPTTVEVIRSN